MKSFLKGVLRDFLAMVFICLLCILLFGAFDTGLDRVGQAAKQPQYQSSVYMEVAR
jgi:hypothetical protein